MLYLLLLLASTVFGEIGRLDGWNYINLHCRDNDNSPVDWWIIYKPPMGDLPWETGRNFSYISSTNAGNWHSSEVLITGSSMLQHTLSPMFRPTYSDHLAKITYQARETKGEYFGSTASGVMLADEMGGVWVSHTVPGPPYLKHDHLHFPENEIKNGHLIICLSADFITLNDLARALRGVEPTVFSVEVPDSVKKWLPDWITIKENLRIPARNKNDINPLSDLDFRTNGETLRAHLMVRRPGEKRCLYKTFAKKRRIVLDVYGHDRRAPTVCEKAYSVRKIDAISLKLPENVIYINNKTDRIGFAVSTGGPWQRTGSAKQQYWVCLGSSEAGEMSGKGGLVLCLEDYEVWRSFDTLKIKEPEC